MGKAQSFNEYAMIQSAIIETRRKIEARNDSIERQRELLLAQEDTLKRGKLMEQIESQKKIIERDKKLLKSLEEKAEKTAMKGNLSEEDRHKAQNLANKGFEKDGTRKTQTHDKTENIVNKNRKTNDDAEKGKGTSEKEKGELEKKIRDAKRTSSEKERNKDRKAINGENERNGTSRKERSEDGKDSKDLFYKKNKPDLSLQLADARERLHIAEDHFKNSLNTQTHNAFTRTRKEE